MRKFLLCVTILVLSGCSASLEDKLGAESEPCNSDNDCRFEFICNQGLCVDPDDVDPAPDSQTPDMSPGVEPDQEPDFEPDQEPDFEPDQEPDFEPDPDPPPIEEICTDVCDLLEECDFGGGRECIQGCTRDLRGREDQALCLLELSCDELINADQFCFDEDFNNDDEDVVENCFNACDRLSQCDELSDRCGRDLSEEVVDSCFEICEDDPGLRRQVAQVSDFPCDDLTEAFIQGFGIENECN
jgi:hypothetical protein